MSLKQVTIHTDGGCQGNPGPGAWAAVLEFGPHLREISGGELATTNNRMELCAAIFALESLKEPCLVELHTDSNYVKDGITQWIRGWKAKNWLTSKKKPVKNADLWRRLDQACQPHQISWNWLKGHAGHPANERCDQLATAAIEEIRQKHSKQELKTALQSFQAQQHAAESQASTDSLF